MKRHSNKYSKIGVSVFFALFILWGFTTFTLGPVDEAINPKIYINGQNSIDCTQIDDNDIQSFDLEVDYTDAYSTENYEVNTINYNPAIPFDNVSTVSTKLEFNRIDEFATEGVTFFPFGFMNITGNQVAVGENGVISFNAQNVALLNLREPSGNIPDADLTKNSIFAAHTDLVFDVADPNSGVYYSIIGAEPARKLVITYLNAGLFDCSITNKVNVQVVLEETTNAIRIHLKEKDLNCSTNINYSTLIGILDITGTYGYAAPGRDYSNGNWSDNNIAWEFIPNGTKGPEIAWYEGAYSNTNPIIGTTYQITVDTSPSDIYYTVLITYPNGIILGDDIQVAEFLPEVENKTLNTCNDIIDLTSYENDFTLVDPSNFIIQYYSDINLTTAITNPTAYNINSGNIVYAKVSNASNNTCYEVATLTFYKNTYPVPNILAICDMAEDNVELGYDLFLLNNQIFSNSGSYNIEYFSSATSNTNIRYLDIYPGTQIWVEIINNQQCRSARIGPIDLEFAPLPTITVPATGIELIMCDGQFNFSELIDKYGTWKDLLLANGLVLDNPNYDVSVHLSNLDAINDSNAISDIVLDNQNPNYSDLNNSISDFYYIRVENSAGCYQIFSIPIDIRFFGVNADRARKYICSSMTTINVDLECIVPEMLIEMYDISGNHIIDVNQIINNIKITYHDNASSANNINSNGISPLITVDASVAKLTNYFVRFELCDSCDDGKPCYTVKPISFEKIATDILTNQIQVCRTSSGSQTVNNLAIFNSDLIDNSDRYTILYFLSRSDADDNSNAISSYTFTGNNDLWVKVISKALPSQSTCISTPVGTICEEIHKVNFIFGATVTPITFPPQSIGPVCDNNNDLQEEFDLTSLENDIYNGAATFTYFARFDPQNYTLRNLISNPETYLIQGDPTISTTSAQAIVYVKVNYDGNSCYEIVVLDITLNFAPPIAIDAGYLCACLPSPGQYATFDLSLAIDDMYNANMNASNGIDFANISVEYYKSLDDANAGRDEILLPNNFPSEFGVHPVYLKYINTATQCYTVGVLSLKNLVQPVPIEGDLKVCDTNFNGHPDVFLENINDIVMPHNSESYFYNYYWTRDDAINSTNPILGLSFDPYDATLSLEDTFYEIQGSPEYIYVKVESDNNVCPQSQFTTQGYCNGINRVKLIPGNAINTLKNSFTIPPICDTFINTGLIGEPTYNDGISSGIDLAQFEIELANVITSPITIKSLFYYKTLDDVQKDTYPYGNTSIPTPELTNFTNADEQGNPLNIIYLKVETFEQGWCPILFEIKMNIVNGPTIVPQPNYYLCPGGTTDIFLENPNGNDLSNYDFEWVLPDGSIINNQIEILNADQIGIYSISITDKLTSCKTPTYEFEVSTIDPPSIAELKVIDESLIEVIALGDPKFTIEYSIDGINFQESNIFDNLPFGVYTIWVRYQENDECIGDPMQTILLRINNVITPNGDGKNDCIIINNLSVFGQDKTIFIVYDRYGKELFKALDNERVEWCGSYLGRNLGTTDYWYTLFLPDGREKSGHITLINY